ncbi:hypothetical protein K438DRAFT_1765463 [Mycena galopus ATCC 62051]|nr:hypothetical protein K438DRAFT_1765463 [Mycena galopus ATCC 62051]
MSTLLTASQLSFCQQFPQGRLCRFVNRLSGTLLDIQPNMTMVQDKVPQVVGNAATAATGVQYVNGSVGSLDITDQPESVDDHTPRRWQAIIPVPKDGSSTLRYLSASSRPGVAITTPPGLVEQWTVQVVLYPYSGSQQQFWLLQFLPFLLLAVRRRERESTGLGSSRAKAQKYPSTHIKKTPNDLEEAFTGLYQEKNLWLKNVVAQRCHSPFDQKIRDNNPLAVNLTSPPSHRTPYSVRAVDSRVWIVAEGIAAAGSIPGEQVARAGSGNGNASWNLIINNSKYAVRLFLFGYSDKDKYTPMVYAFTTPVCGAKDLSARSILLILLSW